MIDSKFIFVFILIIGIISCKTIKPIDHYKWVVPDRPANHPVNFVGKDDGLYIDKKSSVNLLTNIEEMDAYTEKLEALIYEMKKYYGAK